MSVPAIAQASNGPPGPPDWRYTLSIHDIARADDEQKLTELLTANPDRVLVRLSDGRTVAHAAAESGALRSLAVLGKVNADLNVTDTRHRTPLTIAIGMHFTNTVKALIDLKADVNKPGAPDPAADGSTETNDSTTRLPMNIAIRRNYPDVLKLLLAAKADVNARDADGSTPLTTAAAIGNWDFASQLLEAGANVNVADAQGMTALLYAAAASDEKQVAALLARNANPRAVDKSGRSALALTHSGAIWKQLVAKGADVNLVVGGMTPLQHFINQGNLELVTVWLEYNPDPFVTDRQGRTAKELAKRAASTDNSSGRRRIVTLVEEYQAQYLADALKKEAASQPATTAATRPATRP
jgi:ankyrin repeat protein